MGNGGARATNFLDIHSLSVANEPTLSLSKNRHGRRLTFGWELDTMGVSVIGEVSPISQPVGSSHARGTSDAPLVY